MKSSKGAERSVAFAEILPRTSRVQTRKVREQKLRMTTTTQRRRTQDLAALKTVDKNASPELVDDGCIREDVNNHLRNGLQRHLLLLMLR